jgi:hypothetical protein
MRGITGGGDAGTERRVQTRRIVQGVGKVTVVLIRPPVPQSEALERVYQILAINWKGEGSAGSSS